MQKCSIDYQLVCVVIVDAKSLEMNKITNKRPVVAHIKKKQRREALIRGEALFNQRGFINSAQLGALLRFQLKIQINCPCTFRNSYL